MADTYTLEMDVSKLRLPSPAVMAQVDMHVEATAWHILTDARLSIQNPPKSGRTYKRGKRGRMHQASARGEAPATDTGNLAADSGVENMGLGARKVWFGAEYATILENPSQLDRPFLAPAIEKNRERFVDGIKAILRAGL